MDYQHITTTSIDNSIQLVTLSRPDSANALNRLMAEELASAIKLAIQNIHIRAIIVTGAGERAFCAGADLKERKGMNEAQWHEQHAAFEHALQTLLHCPKPLIAAVNGAALGGGLELALACDFIYASNNATFGLTEATLGIMPGLGGTQQLPRAIGMRLAKEMLYTGKVISADDAFSIQLVNEVCIPELLLSDVIQTAHIIACNGPLSVTHIKQAVEKGSTQSLSDALQTELYYYNQLLDTHDRHEGINAFNEKRKPIFSGN